MRKLGFLVFLLQTLCGCGQEAPSLLQANVDTLLLPLGGNPVPVYRSQYGGAPVPFFVHLHHNEQTADSAAHHWLQQNGGVLVSLQNNRQRLLAFYLNGRQHRFDPNRMFTRRGAQKSLELLGPFSEQALQAVRQFANSLLSLIPDSVPIVALHNNTDGAYSLRSYLPGGELKAEAGEVFQNPEMDPDNFVLTTDAAVFEALRRAGINAVLQNNAAADDGSLGFVLGKMGRSYANVEAEQGHWQEQVRILEALMTVWQQNN